MTDLFLGGDVTAITSLIERGALFVVNHSGGKDSQAMLAHVRSAVPADQILIIHADLGEDVEWAGALDHIRATSGNLPIITDPARRQCTSDLKRGPIEREIRRYLKDHPDFAGLIVNCMGMRAAESPGRAKLETLKRNERNSKAGREWYDWLPIHAWSTEEVFSAIAAAHQEPHEIYSLGMSRFSCRFCIMANKADLTTAAGLAPAHYRRLCALERKLGHTLSPSRKYLPEITGIAA